MVTSCFATSASSAAASLTSREIGVALEKFEARAVALERVRQATVMETPALERTSTVGVATKPEPKRRALFPALMVGIGVVEGVICL